MGGGRPGIVGGFYSNDLLMMGTFHWVSGRLTKKFCDSFEHPQTPSRGVRTFEQKLPVSVPPPRPKPQKLNPDRCILSFYRIFIARIFHADIIGKWNNVKRTATVHI